VAEEVVQDVFLQLWRNAHVYQASRGALAAWLATLARNRALDYLRGRRERERRREEALDPDPPARMDNAMEDRMDLRRRADRARALVASLPEAQRRAIELAYFEGMTHSEIAAAMQEPLGTVKSWIRNALLRLREALEGTA
jgi:RNA polymerase sigma-70 factor (ECF subfamily)